MDYSLHLLRLQKIHITQHIFLYLEIGMGKIAILDNFNNQNWVGTLILLEGEDSFSVLYRSAVYSLCVYCTPSTLVFSASGLNLCKF